MSDQTIWPVGVFSSIDAGLGVHLEVAADLGIPTIQLHAPSPSSRTAKSAENFLARIADYEIGLTAVFGGFEGESYADIPTVERTVGLVPAEFRAARLKVMKEISDFARLLKCNVIALHLGFVPHDRSSDPYRQILEVTKQLCNYAKNNGQNLHLETGQETAESLIRFMDETSCDNLFVNFDPANMILYGTGEPMGALAKLGDRVHSVHCKDATWAKMPGIEWGREVPFGQGNVDARKFLETLWNLGYQGPLTIEREIPSEPARQKTEIASAVSLIRQLRREIAGTD